MILLIIVIDTFMKVNCSISLSTNNDQVVYTNGNFQTLPEDAFSKPHIPSGSYN